MKRTLKEIAATITVNFVRIGFNPETEQTDFIAIINHARPRPTTYCIPCD
jgi:hypothetical protein